LDIVQIGVIGVAGVILAIQFRNGKSEYSIYISMAVSMLVFFFILSQMRIFIELIQEISGFMNLRNAYIATLLKMLGITYVSEFAAAICKDAGYQAIAGQIEISAKLFLMGLSVPVLLSLLEVIREFLV
jgi:stage III sporulation protein AD